MKYMSYELENGIGIITFMREDKLNSFNREMWQELYNILDQEKGNDNLRVLIITGKGRAFSAGNDIYEMDKLTRTEDLYEFFSNGFARVLRAVSGFPVPTIGAINGLAYGGGFEMTLMFDLVVSSKTAKFAFPELKIGLIPPAGLTVNPSLIGLKKAAKLTLLGEPITAEEAFEMGIVDFLVEPEELMDRAREIAEKIANSDPLAVKVAKKWIARQRNMVFFEEASGELVFLANSQFARESLAKFLKK